MAFSIGAKLQGQFSSAFKGAQSQIAALQGEINSLNKTQSDISAYQKQQQAIEHTEGKLNVLRQQYDNLKSAMGQSGDASAQLKNQMLQKGLAIEQATQKLADQQTKLDTLGNALNEAGVDTNNLGKAEQDLAQQTGDLKKQQEELADATEEAGSSFEDAAQSASSLLSALGVVSAVKALYSAFKECADAAIEYEHAMAGVRRTVGGTDEFLDDLSESFKEMATEMPITTAELAAIATTAGQLGIAQQNVEVFTSVMAQLATTTDLTADAAATMLAQFANITGLTDYQRMGSVIAELGDATATTASKVVQMSQGMAASASIAGFSATDIMAVSAALGSLGIEAQAGATSMSQLISTLYMAVETGEGLEEFASVANMSAAEFKRAWAEDAVGAMNAFIQGLNDTERNGRSAIVILNELGITNVRQTKAILGLAQAGNLLSDTVAQASAAWEQNTALSEKAAIMYETTQSQLTMMNSAVNNLKIAVGDALTPVIQEVAGFMTQIITPVTTFIHEHPALVKAIAAAAAVIGVVIAALTAYVAITKIATIVSAAFTAAIPGVGMILAVAGAVAALVGVTTYLTSTTEEATEAVKEETKSFAEVNDEFENAMAGYRKQTEISRLVDRYGELTQSIKTAKNQAVSLDGTTTEITLTATAEESVTVDEFIIDDDFTVDDISATAAESITPDEFLTDDDTVIEGISGEAAESIDPYEFLKDDAVQIEASPGVSLDQQSFVGTDAALITGTNGNTIDAQNYIDSEDIALIAGAEGNAISAQSYIDGTALISAGQGNTIDADEFITADTVAKIAGQTGNTIDAQKYISGTASITGEPVEESIDAQDYIAGQAVISAEHGEAISAQGFIGEGDLAEIAGKAKADLENSEFLNVESAAALIEGTADAKLENGQFLNADSDAALIAGAPGNLLGNGQFLNADSDAALITGKADPSLTDEMFMAEEREAVKITAEADKTLVDDSFYAEDNEEYIYVNAHPGDELLTDIDFYTTPTDTGDFITLSAQPDTENPLSAEDLLDGTTVSLSASAPVEDSEKLSPDDFLSGTEFELTVTDIQITEDASANLAGLQTRLATVRDDFISAKSTLAEMETRYGQLEARLKYSQDEETKSALRTEMEALSTEIGNQETAVGKLEQAYIDANNEYNEAAAAANDLAEKEAELAGIKETLAGLGYDVADATEEETTKLLEQLDAYKQINEIEKASYAVKMQKALGEGASTYARYRASQQIWVYYDEAQKLYKEAIDYTHKTSHTNLGYGNTSGSYTELWSVLEKMTAGNLSLQEQAQWAWESTYHQNAENYDLYNRGRTRTDGYYFYTQSVAEWKSFWDQVNAIYDEFSSTDNTAAQEYLDSWVEYARTLGKTADETVAEMSGYLLDLNEADQEYAYNYVRSHLAVEEAAEATAQAESNIAEAITPTIEKMEALADAYEEVYNAAYKSIDGQFDLFESVEAISPTLDEAKEAVKGYVDALISQAAYMAQYKENLLAVKEMGLSDTLVAQLSDGSTESAAILANIVAGGESYIDELNTAFAGVETGKEDFANTVAEMQTNFTESMAYLEAQLQTTVENMEMSEEAAAAAESTIDAFAAAAEGRTEAVAKAFARIAAAARAALAGGDVDLDGYASGTSSAERGYKLVGEDGPELVYFNGGETVLDAQETRDALSAEPTNALSSSSGSNYVIEINPQYNFNGSDAGSFGDLMDRNNEALRDTVEQILADIEDDRVRSAYS